MAPMPTTASPVSSTKAINALSDVEGAFSYAPKNTRNVEKTIDNYIVIRYNEYIGSRYNGNR